MIVQIKMNSHTSHCKHYRIDMHLVDSRFTRLKTVNTRFEIELVDCLFIRDEPLRICKNRPTN
jgi:hypothetical protein